jgi:glutathione synthase/RimK-type ligase-like ATP-grasp enzyme
MRKTIFLLTEEDGFFGQGMMPWESIDIGRLRSRLEEHFEVRTISYEDVASSGIDLTGNTIIHSSSQQPEYKAYIDDILLYLKARQNTLIPSIHVTRSHENKGYQELHRRLVGLPSLGAVYLAKRSETIERGVRLPTVYKELSGFGSTGVKLVDSRRTLNSTTRPDRTIPVSLLPRIVRRVIGNHFRKHILRRRNLEPYGSYYSPLKRYVLQDFVPEMDFDYKVLIFPSKAFVLRRDVRAGDFRASGSGHFEFVEPAPELLDYAKSVLELFQEPYLSLDIIYDGHDYHVIEFQGVHFGPYTVVSSPFHFELENNNWSKVSGKSYLEDELSNAILIHLSRSIDRQAKSA